MVIVDGDVVVKYTLLKKNVERFSIGRDKLHLTTGAPWRVLKLLELSY